MRKTILLLATLFACVLLAPATALAQGGTVFFGSRSMIGVHTEPVTVAGRQVLRVVRVVPGFPAETAGLQADDLIVAVDGQPATTQLLSADRAVGTKLRLRISRDGREHDTELETVERRPATTPWGVYPLPDSVLGQMAIIMSNVRTQADSLSGVVSRVRVDTLRGVRDTVIVHRFAQDREALAAMRIGDDSVRVLRFGTDSVHVLRFGRDTVRFRFPAAGARFEMREGEFHTLPRPDPSGLPRAHFDSVASAFFFRTLPDSLRPAGEAAAVYRLRPSDIATTTIFAGTTAIAGAALSELNPGLAEYFGGLEGVLVLDAPAGTPAERAGIRAGDVIVRVNDTAVTSIPEIRRALRSGPVQIRLMRRGQTIDVTVGSE